MTKTVAIVGAGPAGLRAAQVLVQAGLRPVLIDEAARVGGQIYRQPPPALQRAPRALYGFEAGKALALFNGFEQFREQVDYRPETLVWHLEDRQLHLLRAGRAEVLAFDGLILATGATDRVFPFPGWTLPGVFTLGAAQVALKGQASLIGPRVVFAGTGPLLYYVAWQYLQAGAQLMAVLDSAPPAARWRALPQLMARPSVLAKGAYFLARLQGAGVQVQRGVQLLRAEGQGRVQQVFAQVGGTADGQAAGRCFPIECDAIAFGHGLRSETQLADLAGCAFAFDDTDQAWLPQQDDQGRSSVHGVYLAGDGSGILGADAAELTGARAARALLADSGGAQPLHSAALAPHRRFRAGLETLCPLPAGWAASAPDDLVVCRCEEVTAGDLRACARDTGTRELSRLKALTRIGMGRCQGRMCAPAAAQLLAQAVGCPVKDVGRLRAQPPVKPVPIVALGAALSSALGNAEEAPGSAVPADQRDD